MTQRIHVTVEVDTDELRKWADRHADSGNHGVAHVLYKAASDGESLSEQTIRAAVIEEGERIARAIETVRIICPDHGISDCSPLLNGCGVPIRLHARKVEDARIARADRNPNGGGS